MPPVNVATILSTTDLDRLQQAFGDGAVVEGLLVGTLPVIHPRTKTYVETLAGLFHDTARNRPPEGRAVVSSDDRERCIISILASRGEQRNLALHIYIALMLKISVAEIADILFLTAVYSGIPAMADGMSLFQTTLEILKEAATSNQTDVKAVLGKLMALPL